jgi:hypothetical protein
MVTENKISSVSDAQQSATEDSESSVSASLDSANLLEAPQAACKENDPSDGEDSYADAYHVTTRPEDSTTVLNGGLALSEPRSRANSTTSCASKPDDWHPYDRPPPAYARKKLWPLFHDDPTLDPFSKGTTHVILRAVH